MASETKAESPISDTNIVITHRTITSKLSFTDTLAALESAIPRINHDYKPHLKAGRYADALEALENLAPLNNFMFLDRDFGQLVRAHGITGKNAIQCEIGNPYSASKMAKYNLGAAVSPELFVPS